MQEPAINCERFKADTNRHIFEVFDSLCVAALCVSSYSSYTVIVTTVAFRQICSWKALTLASTCRYFAQDIQYFVRGAVHIPIIHILQYSMLHNLDCGIHTSPDEEDVQANPLVLSSLRPQVLHLR